VRSLDAFRFVFFRFKPERYFYGAILFGRNLLICLVPVAVRTDAALQAIVMIIILLVSVVLQSFLQPWRSQAANYGDAIMTSALIILLLCGAMSTDYDSSKGRESIKAVGVTIFTAFLLSAGLFLIVAAQKRIRPSPFFKTFICHDDYVSAAQARILKVILENHDGQDVFIDPDQKINTGEHFDMVRCKTERLVVYLTRDSLRNLPFSKMI